jgi:hypothetical protein
MSGADPVTAAITRSVPPTSQPIDRTSSSSIGLMSQRMSDGIARRIDEGSIISSVVRGDQRFEHF